MEDHLVRIQQHEHKQKFSALQHGRIEVICVGRSLELEWQAHIKDETNSH